MAAICLVVAVAGVSLAGCGNRADARAELCSDLDQLRPTLALLEHPPASSHVAELRDGLEKVETIVDDVDRLSAGDPRRVGDRLWSAVTGYRASLDGVRDDRRVWGDGGPNVRPPAAILPIAVGAVRSSMACDG